MRYVFIDSNIYLRFYGYAEDDFLELEKFVALLDAKKIKVFVTEQVNNEVLRNRDAEINAAMEKFSRSVIAPQIPRFACELPEAIEIVEAGKSAAKAKNKVLEILSQQIAEKSLRADKLIYELMDKATFLETTDEIMSRADVRRKKGNPPGKPESLGDQINWEALLLVDEHDIDLDIVTIDGDFFSKYGQGSPATLLSGEWADAKGGKLNVHKSLASLAKAHFPDIKLPSDIVKADAISELVSSGNFTWTHYQISRLESVFDQLTKDDAAILFQAFVSNSQINWIAKDEDVKSFYLKLYEKFGSENSLEMDDKLDDIVDYFPTIPF